MATSIAPIAPVDPPVIKAAGGILQRMTPRGDEVMVVYRTRHQDWTLPRGQVKDGESFQEAAMRQVLEETGCSCRIGNYLGTISYSDQGVPKVVLFWKMTLVEDKGRNGQRGNRAGVVAATARRHRTPDACAGKGIALSSWEPSQTITITRGAGAGFSSNDPRGGGVAARKPARRCAGPSRSIAFAA